MLRPRPYACSAGRNATQAAPWWQAAAAAPMASPSQLQVLALVMGMVATTLTPIPSPLLPGGGAAHRRTASWQVRCPLGYGHFAWLTDGARMQQVQWMDSAQDWQVAYLQKQHCCALMQPAWHQQGGKQLACCLTIPVLCLQPKLRKTRNEHQERVLSFVFAASTPVHLNYCVTS